CARKEKKLLVCCRKVRSGRTTLEWVPSSRNGQARENRDSRTVQASRIARTGGQVQPLTSKWSRRARRPMPSCRCARGSFTVRRPSRKARGGQRCSRLLAVLNRIPACEKQLFSARLTSRVWIPAKSLRYGGGPEAFSVHASGSSNT